eukprot:m.258402 g.258402  ORF g.258402 m.258402 type:complete len:115 (+) comp22719_c1_seq9:161-505(+)
MKAVLLIRGWQDDVVADLGGVVARSPRVWSVRSLRKKAVLTPSGLGRGFSNGKLKLAQSTAKRDMPEAAVAVAAAGRWWHKTSAVGVQAGAGECGWSTSGLAESAAAAKCFLQD